MYLTVEPLPGGHGPAYKTPAIPAVPDWRRTTAGDFNGHIAYGDAFLDKIGAPTRGAGAVRVSVDKPAALLTSRSKLFSTGADENGIARHPAQTARRVT